MCAFSVWPTSSSSSLGDGLPRSVPHCRWPRRKIGPARVFLFRRRGRAGVHKSGGNTRSAQGWHLVMNRRHLAFALTSRPRIKACGRARDRRGDGMVCPALQQCSVGKPAHWRRSPGPSENVRKIKKYIRMTLGCSVVFYFLFRGVAVKGTSIRKPVQCTGSSVFLSPLRKLGQSRLLLLCLFFAPSSSSGSLVGTQSFPGEMSPFLTVAARALVEVSIFGAFRTNLPQCGPCGCVASATFSAWRRLSRVTLYFPLGARDDVFSFFSFDECFSLVLLVVRILVLFLRVSRVVSKDETSFLCKHRSLLFGDVSE